MPYSARTDPDAFRDLDRIPCHIVYTNAETHRIIRENIHRSAMYSGKIHGTGPRYCPPPLRIKSSALPIRSATSCLSSRWDVTPRKCTSRASPPPPDRRPAGHGAFPARLFGRRDHALRLRHRVRLRRPPAALPLPLPSSSMTACTAPDSSTAPPATRKPRRRDLWLASTRRCRCSANRPRSSRAPAAASAPRLMTLSRAAPMSRTA